MSYSLGYIVVLRCCTENVLQASCSHLDFDVLPWLLAHLAHESPFISMIIVKSKSLVVRFSNVLTRVISCDGWVYACVPIGNDSSVMLELLFPHNEQNRYVSITMHIIDNE